MKNTAVHDCVRSIIKDTLEVKGLDYKEICKKLEINQTRFTNCMAGISKLNAAEFISVCVFLGLNLEDFKESYIK